MPTLISYEVKNLNHKFMQNEQFTEFLCKDQFTDCILVMDSQTIRCHKVILASASQYFKVNKQLRQYHTLINN
jgi:hypothetical protein